MQDMRVTIKDYRVRAEFKTHWGDEDAARHINNLVYLRWAETARVQYFEAMGMDIAFSGDGTGAILAWQDCKYIFPMNHPDEALVGVRCVEILADRFVLETGIFSKRNNRIVAITRQHIVPYNYANLRKALLPEDWQKGIRMIDGEVKQVTNF